LNFEFEFFLGAASLEVQQEIEYCMPEARIMSLLIGLQKTPPPVKINMIEKKYFHFRMIRF
jgi:hypothetical protein